MKRIIIDVSNDRGLGFLRHMLGDNAIPEPVQKILSGMLGDDFASSDNPMQHKNCKYLWPEKNAFPTASMKDLILNHLYATAQDSVPRDVIDKIKQELIPFLTSAKDEGEDGELKRALIKGSTKKYHKVLTDGTEISVEVKSPVETSGDEDVLQKISAIVENKEKELEENFNKKIAKIDLSKAVGTFGAMSSFDRKLEDFSVKLAQLANVSGSMVIENKGKFRELINRAADHVSSGWGLDKRAFLEKLAATEDSEHKEVVGGMVIDKRRLSEKPYNDRSNAKKALPKTVFNKICDPISGHILLNKLKKQVSEADGNPLLERITDNVLKSVRWVDKDA